ncbi:MAG TPA: hypothetical protein VKG24_05080, partial [Pseudolabrys sp.]|nr:hypothetical protein [Pseudolabrys sp.]
MLKDIITADQLSLVISQAAAPAFLLGAVASFLSVTHMSRILDRSRTITDNSADDPKTRTENAAPGAAVARDPGHPRDLLGGRKRYHDLRPHDRSLRLSL